MTDDRARPRLAKLVNEATPGPWTRAVDSHAPSNGKRIAWVETESAVVADIPNSVRSIANATLIAEMHTTLPELLAENARLREALVLLRDDYEKFLRWYKLGATHSLLEVEIDALRKDVAVADAALGVKP